MSDLRQSCLDVAEVRERLGGMSRQVLLQCHIKCHNSQVYIHIFYIDVYVLWVYHVAAELGWSSTMESGSAAAAAAAAVASGDAKGLDKNTLVAVLQFLNKNNLQVSCSSGKQ